MLAEIASKVVSEGKQREVRTEEPVGKAVAHDYADLDGEQVGLVSWVFPHSHAAFFDVCLVE